MAVIKPKKLKDRDDDFGVWLANRNKNDPRAQKAMAEREAWLIKMGTMKPSEAKTKKSAPKKTTAKKKK